LTVFRRRPPPSGPLRIGRLEQEHAVYQPRSKRRQISRLLLDLVVGVAENQEEFLLEEGVFRATHYLSVERIGSRDVRIRSILARRAADI